MCKWSEKCNRIFKHQFEIIQTPVWNSKTTICKTSPPFETETRFKNLKCCILLHLIYHKDKTGVVYSERCNIACHCVLLHQIYHKDKTGVVYSEMCNIALCLCISLHLLYHEDKTGVVYSKRCNIALCLCISLHLLYHNTKLVLCNQNGTVSPLEFVHKVQMLNLRGLCTCMRVY